MPTRILILGGGFGGVYTARHLEHLLQASRDVEITLISRDNYFLMTPLLFEAGSGILEPRHAVNPLRPLLHRTRFVEGEIERIDVEKNIVYARQPPDEVFELPYDHLVLALGGVTNRSIIPGSDKALTFKTLADAIYLRNHTIELFERADVEQDPVRKAQLLTFIIVGAGLVGIELIGELTEFTKNLVRSYPRIQWSDLKFIILEAGPNIMPEMPRDLADYAVDVLKRRGVDVRANAPAASIEVDSISIKDAAEPIRASTIILAAGVAANPLLKDLPVEKDRKGRVATHPTMQSKSHANVWALGDCAMIPDPNGKPYPQLAQHALREAKTLAQNIVATLHRQPTKPFVFETLGTLAALGHYKGIGRVWKFKLKGFAAWWVWRSYYLFQMPRWERRLRIMLDWSVGLFFKNDIAKLDLFGEEHPLEHAPIKMPGGPRTEMLPPGNDSKPAPMDARQKGDEAYMRP